MIRKYQTWVIPSKDLKTTETKKASELEEVLQSELSDVLGDIMDGIQVSFKISNIEREYD